MYIWRTHCYIFHIWSLYWKDKLDIIELNQAQWVLLWWKVNQNLCEWWGFWPYNKPLIISSPPRPLILNLFCPLVDPNNPLTHRGPVTQFFIHKAYCFIQPCSEWRSATSTKTGPIRDVFFYFPALLFVEMDLKLKGVVTSALQAVPWYISKKQCHGSPWKIQGEQGQYQLIWDSFRGKFS